MGNTVSCCLRANPGDRQEEGQRLQNEGIKQEVAPGQVSILPQQKEVAAGLVSEVLADSTKTVATKSIDEVTGKGDAFREPPASPVVTNLHANAPSAVDDSIFLHQQEVAAALVSQVLADSTKTVATKSIDEVTGKGDAFREPPASPVVTNLHANAPSAVDDSIFLHQQEVAAALVSQVLADATELVASGHITKVNEKGDVFFEKKGRQAMSAEKLDSRAASTNTSSEAVTTGMEKQAAANKVEICDVSTLCLPKKLESQEMSTLIENKAAATNLREELCNGDNRSSSLPSVPAEKAVRAEIRGSAADGLSAESSLGDLLEGQETPEGSKIPKQAQLQVEAKSAPSAKFSTWVLVLERPFGYSVEGQETPEESQIPKQAQLDVEAKSAKFSTWVLVMEKPLGYSATIPESASLMTPVKKAAFAEPQQDLVSSNGSLAEESARCISVGFHIAHPGEHLKEEASSKVINTTKGLMITSTQPSTKDEDGVNYDNIISHGGIWTKETVDVVMLSQEDPTTITSAVKLEDRLVLNPSAEGLVSKAPKGFPLVSEIDAHLDRCGHQPLLESSKALDGEEDVPLHSSEDERLLTSAMLGTGFPFMNAKLAEAISQHRSDSGHSFSMEGQHPESGLHLNSVSSDASARGSAAASTAQDMVFGLSTKSQSVPLPKLLAHPGEHLKEEASSKVVNTTKGLMITSTQPSTKDEDGVNYDDIISHGGIWTKETVDVVMLSQEDPTTITSAVKLEDRLVLNPSAEGLVSKVPKGFPLVSEIDAHLDRCGHQPLLDSSKALDGEQDVPLHSSEDERLLASAMLGTGFPFMNGKLAEAISQHRSDSGHSFSMEGQHPDSCLHLNSVSADASARGSAAASTAQNMVFGLSTKSQSVPLPKLLAELAELQKVVVSSNASTRRGLAVNLQAERPGSAGRWSPVSDGSEAWFTCDEDLYYSEEEIEEELAGQCVMEITGD